MLVLRGVRVDVINELSIHDYTGDSRAVFEQLHIWKSMEKIYRSTGQDRLEVLWRTLIVDMSWPSSRRAIYLAKDKCCVVV